MVGVLRSPDQAGYPPSIATDAQLGSSVMAYHSAEVLFDRRGGDGHFLVALRERARQPAKGVKENLPNGRKSGAVLAALAPPARRRRLDTWRESTLDTRPAGFNCGGILAPGRSDFFAAATYARDSGCLSSAWDWAQSLVLKPPALFDGYFGADRPSSPAPSPQDDPPGTSKPTIQLSAAAPSTPDEILRCRRHPPTQQSSPGATTLPPPPPTQPRALW